MSNRNPLDYSINKPISSGYSPIKYVLKDIPLFVSLSGVLTFGLIMLYSSSGQSLSMGNPTVCLRYSWSFINDFYISFKTRFLQEYFDAFLLGRNFSFNLCTS